MTLPTLTSFTAYTKIRSSEVSGNFTAVYNVLNGNLDNANIAASAAIARSKLASGTADHVLINSGAGAVSSEAQLATGRGGTGIAAYSVGDLLYGSATNVLSRLTGNTTITRKFLRQTGDGANSAAPAWDTLTAADVGLTTKGDILSYSTQMARLAVGTNGKVLTADSTESTGLKWDTPWSSASFSTGDIKMTIKTTADSGWVMMDDKTIGDGSSGATGRANADTESLFTLLWTNISDTYAPVSTGRGASAAADFAAHKTIALPKTLGRALAVAGAGAGLTSRSLGQTAGTETHTLSESEIPSHQHATGVGANSNINSWGQTSDQAMSGTAIGAYNPSKSGFTGGGGAHNNMQPSSFLNVMIKL